MGRASRAVVEWLALGGTLAALLAYTLYDLRSVREAIETGERQQLEHQARIVERMLETRFQATTNALDALREVAPGLRREPDGTARLSERMRVMAASMAGVRTFLVVNAGGICFASSRPELLGHDFREGERYRAMSARPDPAMLFVSPPFLTPLGNWTLSLGRVLLDERGGFDGYVLAIIDPDYWNLLLDSTRYAPDMGVAMIHGAGKIIWRVPDPKGAVGMDLSKIPESPFTRHVASGKGTTSWTDVLASTGTRQLIVLQTIQPSTGPASGYLVATFSRSPETFLAPWRTEVRDHLSMVALLAVASCAGLAVLQRRRRADARLADEREAERLRQAEARAAVQAQLEQSHRLESIGRLAGGVAHDFNNLLTVILSVAEEARDEARRGRAPDPGALEEMVGAARRAADLTRQLLAFARRQIAAPVVLDVNEQLRNSEKLLRRVIGEDVRVVLDLAPDPWPVRCDPGLLGQVVLNLAVNARDAMPDGGTLTVITRNVTIAPGDAVPDAQVVPGDYVRLAVEDTGTGMSPEVLAHIFEPFYTTKEVGKGTGLGLATVYGIVKQSGAFMEVRSTPGRGSAFAILFPRQPAEEGRAAAGEKGGTGGDEAILVVEDEPAVRKAMVQALRAGGYRVRIASGAREAVEVATAEPGGIQLLLTDVIMPGDGGREVARRVLDACPGVRVLYVSGYTDDAISRKGVLEEGSEFLSKPFTPEVLRSRVREILDRVPAPAPGAA